MDIGGRLVFGEVRGHRGEEIVHRDAFFLHQRGGDLVALDDRGGCLFRRCDIGDGRRRGPDQPRPGRGESIDDFTEPRTVIIDRRGSVVDAEIEMDQVPFAVAEPDRETVDSRLGRTAIRRSTVHIHLARERLAHRLGVAPRDRVTDQQHPRQSRIILDKIPGIAASGDLFLLMDGKVKAAEILLQDFFPSLPLGRKGRDPFGILGRDLGLGRRLFRRGFLRIRRLRSSRRADHERIQERENDRGQKRFHAPSIADRRGFSQPRNPLRTGHFIVPSGAPFVVMTCTSWALASG